MKFCVKCGNKINKGIFCPECSVIESPILKDFKEVKVQICSYCKKFFIKNKWVKYDNIKDVLVTYVKKNVKIKGIAFIVNPIIPKTFNQGPGSKNHIEIEIRSGDEEYLIPATVSFTLCPHCSRSTGNYFEGILQLRNCPDHIISFAINELNSKNERGVYITTKEKVKGGVDLTVTSQRYIQSLGKILQEKFKGELKVNVKLFSVDKMTSREVFRTNVLFRMPPFSVGDIVQAKGRKVKILRIGKKVSVIEEETGKKKTFQYKEIR